MRFRSEEINFIISRFNQHERSVVVFEIGQIIKIIFLR